MAGFATCSACNRAMDPGVGCVPTHVAKTKRGKAVKRVFYGEEADDWGASEGRPCHDCNAGPGQPHHDGCDVERCPECGNQMLGCLGPPDNELAELLGQKPCGWQYLVTPKPKAAAKPAEDPIVKVIYKDEGDFGFISTVRRSELGGADPTTPWLEVLAAKRDAGDSIGVPYDPNRQRPYGTRAQAKALASEHGAHYEEV